MPRETTALVKFNAGKLSKQGLARVDLDRTKFSAEIQTNYIPKILGPMTLRPGMGYIGATYQNKKAFHIPFVAATDDTALIELTDMGMRVRIDDTIVSRAAVSIAFTNGTFTTDLTGWTDNDQAGTTSQWGDGSGGVTAGTNTLNANGGFNFSGFTIRQVIDASAITNSGNNVQVTFGSGSGSPFTVSKAYIGHAASSGEAYDFDGTPQALTFNNGSAGFSITSSSTIDSDTVVFALDESRPLVISYYISSTVVNGMGHTGATPGWQGYALVGVDDASTVNTSGYRNDSTVGIGVDGIVSVSTVDTSSGGFMSLKGTGFNKAIRSQTLTVGSSDQNIEHAIRVVVIRGKAHIRVGSNSGSDDYITDTELLPGTHSLAFTPTGGSVFVELSAYTSYATFVDSIAIEASGDMVLPTIWPEANLFGIRFAQSIDVIFCVCYGFRPQRLERHGARSWSVVDYVTEDGPYRSQNVGNTTIAASATSGDITLTANQTYFKSTNVGSLFTLTSIGQTVSSNLNGNGQYTNYIRVIGTGSSRTFSIVTTGTWTGTLTVQRSFTDTTSPADTTTTITTNTTTNFSDGLDNEIVYYRVGFSGTGYGSGTATVTISYSSGGLTGVARVTGYTSPTVVSASVLKDLGGTTATSNWSEGLWSDRRGYPSAISLYEGRLWFAGKGTIVASVSDAYSSFEPSTVGDSGPINRSIGEGPIDKINYIIPLQRLILGGQGSEFSIRSSAFDEIVTPDNFNIKSVSTQGSDNVAAVKMDNSGIFVQQGGTRVYELIYNSDIFDYEVQDLTTLVPEQCQAVITKLVIQRKPDTRIHAILADGTVAMMLYDKAEQVSAWIDITSPGADGFIEDVVVLPGVIEDAVYYSIKRTINSSTVRYVEKWAEESEALGEPLTKLADSFIVYNSTPTTTITGLTTLEGQEVTVWADSMDVGVHTVASGQITLATAASVVVVGLYYAAEFKSVKLAYAGGSDTALTMKKRVPEIGLILNNTHRFGVQYSGVALTGMNDLPADYNGRMMDDDEIIAHYDDSQFTLDGDWNTDSRLYLKSESPKPATILATVLTIETNG